MPDYKLGKIYMIYSIENPEDRYYGSTTQPLSKRFYGHTKENTSTSKLLFEKYGVDGCKIELVEDFPCETKEQLCAREGHYIRTNICVNKKISGRTSKETRQEQPMVECECGTILKKYNFTVHKHTKMHFKKLKNKSI
jgi:hypothetical protein